MSKKVEYETVEDWEKRTGKIYPGTSPVWKKTSSFCGFRLMCYEDASLDKHYYPYIIMLIADDKPIPPKDWEPARKKNKEYSEQTLY